MEVMVLERLNEDNYLQYSGRDVLIQSEEGNYHIGKLHNFDWEDKNMNLHPVDFFRCKIYLLPYWS